MFGVNMFFLILSVLLIYAVFNKRVEGLVDKALQDTSYISFYIGMICGGLLEAVILLKK